MGLFDSGQISINDLELATNFIAERIAEHMLEGRSEGLNTWFGSDNTAAVSWKRKRSARAKAKSYFTPQVLRAEALLQRYTRRGPQDTDHIDGATNLLGDFPSQSYEQGFGAGETHDQAFLTEFTNRHPLPLQLGCWLLVHPPKGIFSAVFSMLRDPQTLSGLSITGTGETGLSLPSVLGNTLFAKQQGTCSPLGTNYAVPGLCCHTAARLISLWSAG
jgi:hypothetical protein